ncbi:MAG: hypothetical protein A3F67_01700 [Verrucomicrobia bacterium RIFCSPHIGHO2_12_FULL_41_10]|nr:MAG: hypothetical protein A3F67_01700 [Verrucomicrobia bacterium RIFCSPHIGHO2_12_FULL_41_10]HLB33757.1 SDR family NAD(P)-dependent oxidoreductase [Chthoniobacterales bacterium]
MHEPSHLHGQFHLEGSTILITGASSGLGAEFAKQLSSFAKEIILVARRGDHLKALSEEIHKKNPEVIIHEKVIDLSVSDQREELARWIVEQKIPLNCLINNAGCGDFGDFASASWLRLHEILLLNIEAFTHLTHLLLPQLRCHAPSAIFNVGSLLGYFSTPHGAVYAASKAFVMNFSEALRIEEASHGVAVSCLASGQFYGSSKFQEKAIGSRAKLPWFVYPNESCFVMHEKEVVQAALKCLSHNCSCITPKFCVKLSGFLIRMLPSFLLGKILSKKW